MLKKLLNEFEIPYVLLDSAGKIMWRNEKFGEMTGIDKKYHKSIASLFPTITKEFLQKNEDATAVEVSFEEKDYRVAIHRITFDAMVEEKPEIVLDAESEYMNALYFFDETELNQYKLENIEQKQVAALVYIDNYDEALESIEDVKRSLLTALIQGYCGDGSGLSGLHWVCFNGRGPHLGLRQEPQVSSPFLTQIEACLQSWDWILRPRLV